MTLEFLRDLLHDGLERGRATYGELGLDPEAFAHGVLERIHARLGADPEGRTGRAWRAAVAAAPLPDLYLAVACEERHEVAWRVLSARFSEGLASTLAAEGVGRNPAAAIVRDHFAELARPIGNGGSTGLAAFDGAGSLLGWLTLRLLRGRPQVPRPAPRPEARGPEEEALLSRWAALPPEARVAIACTARDGLSPRRVGALLHAGEVRVAQAAASAGPEGARAAALAAAGPRGPCLADGPIVAWVEHRLEGAAAAEVLSHLAVCDADRALAFRLATDLGGDLEPTEDAPPVAGREKAGERAASGERGRRKTRKVVVALLIAAAFLGAAWVFVGRR